MRPMRVTGGPLGRPSRVAGCPVWVARRAWNADMPCSHGPRRGHAYRYPSSAQGMAGVWLRSATIMVVLANYSTAMGRLWAGMVASELKRISDSSPKPIDTPRRTSNVGSTSRTQRKVRAMRIITNNNHRHIIDGWELTASEREQFDYIDWAGIEAGTESASFFRYRGELYDLGDMPRAEGRIAELGWDGFASDTFFSGIAVRYVDSYEAVVVGRVLS